MATHAQRQHIVDFLDFAHNHAKHLLYPPGDQRTNRDNVSWNLTESHMETIIRAGGYWQGDCSEFGSYALKCAGLWHWPTAAGWTGSHLKLLPIHYTDGRKARPGALVVFGLADDPNGVHEAIVYEADTKGGDPVVKSHGRAGLDTLRVSDFSGPHYAGHVYLSIEHL